MQKWELTPDRPDTSRHDKLSGRSRKVEGGSASDIRARIRDSDRRDNAFLRTSHTIHEYPEVNLSPLRHTSYHTPPIPPGHVCRTIVLGRSIQIRGRHRASRRIRSIGGGRAHGACRDRMPPYVSGERRVRGCRCGRFSSTECPRTCRRTTSASPAS
jgi:hypothetical protein|eukprot:113638-Prymnesium_polylepis.2